MNKMLGIFGFITGAAVAASWAYYDEASMWAYGWLVVIGLGGCFGALAALFQRDR